MPRRYPSEVRRQVVELARSGTKVAQLVATFGMSEATIYDWLRQESIDRGEISGTSTDMALELAAAKTRIRQLETELAVSRKVNAVQGQPQRLYPVIASLTGRESTCATPAAVWGSRSRATTSGAAARPRLERPGGSSWRRRSPRSRQASTARTGSPPSRASTARSSPATTR